MANGFKTGGRTAGTPNKTTAHLRGVLSEIVSSELACLQCTIEMLPPAERLDVLLRLIPFVVPKPNGMDTEPMDKDIEITMHLGSPV